MTETAMSHRPRDAADAHSPPADATSVPDRRNGLRSGIVRAADFKRRAEDRFGNLAYAFQFGAVGLSGMAVDLGLYALLLQILPLNPARGLAIWVAMTWNFLLNRYVTFADDRGGNIWRQYLGFCLSCAAGAAVNWGLSVGLASTVAWFARWPLAAAVAGILAGFGLNFTFCRLWVFRSRRDR